MADVKLKAVETQKKARKRAPENETNRQRFVRVAGNRLNNALTAIKLLSQIGLSSEYEYSEKDVVAIGNAIAEETKKTLHVLTTKKQEKAAVKLFE